MRDRARLLLLFTPWLTAPLAVLGVYLAVLAPLIGVTWVGWIVYGVGVAGAIALCLVLRVRYRLWILDSSSLGVMTWLQRRL
ncbi:MAG TPA: hypothetical protein VFA56_07325 [Gaiellaceae bacterium]|nr:hypothetical protein [Gaiellaceae bacterium]